MGKKKKRTNRRTPSLRTKPHSLSSISSWKILAFILVLGFSLRIIFFFEIKDSPEFNHPWIDAAFHDYWARGIAFDDWTLPEGMNDPEIRDHAYFRPPGYPYFLAFIYRIFGHNYIAPRLVQLMLGVLNCYLAFLLAIEIFDRRTGLIAATLMATYWGFIYFESELMAPVLLVTLTLSLLWVLIRLNRNPSLLLGSSAGILFGLFALTRPNILLFWPVILIWALWFSYKRNAMKLIRLPLIAFVFCSLSLISTATIRNMIVSGKPVIITSNAGINLFIGNNEKADGVSAILPDVKSLTGLNGWTCFDYAVISRSIRKELGPESSEEDVGQYFSQKALDFITSHPFDAFKLAIKKAFLFWGPAEISNNKVLSLERKGSYVLKWLPGFPLILSLTLLSGLAAIINKKHTYDSEQRSRFLEPISLGIAFVLVYFGSFIPFFIIGRFRIPVIPVLILFAAYAISSLFSSLASSQRKKGMLLLGSWIPLLVVTHTSFITYRAAPSQWHFQKGVAFSMEGNISQALKEFQQALNYEPDSFETLNKVGICFYQLGNTSQALENWEKSIQFRKDQPQILNNLAWIYATHGSSNIRSPEKALQFATQACEQTSYSNSGYLDTLAAAYAISKQWDSAIQFASKGLKLSHSAGLVEQEKGLSQRIELYKNEQPFIDQESSH